MKDLRGMAERRLKSLGDLMSEAPDFARRNGGVVLRTHTRSVKRAILRVWCAEQTDCPNFDIEVRYPLCRK
jgi:hypothetical protein